MSQNLIDHLAKNEENTTPIDAIDIFSKLLRNIWPSISGLNGATEMKYGNISQNYRVKTYGCQIHHVNNHFVVSHLINSKLFIYNSLKTLMIKTNSELIKQIGKLYPFLTLDKTIIEERTVCDQHNTNLCGPISAATAFFVCQQVTRSISILPLNLDKLLNRFNQIAIGNVKLIDFELKGYIVRDNPEFNNPSPATLPDQRYPGGGVWPKKKISRNRRIRRHSLPNTDSLPNSDSMSNTDFFLPDEDVEMEYRPTKQLGGYFSQEYDEKYGIIRKNNVKIKRIIHSLSEFINFSVYELIKNRIRHKFASILDIAHPINYYSNVNSPIYTRSSIEKPICSAKTRRQLYSGTQFDYNKYPIPEISNPTLIKNEVFGKTVDNQLKDYVKTKRYLEEEILIRQGITKKAGKFVKNVLDKIFYNPTIKQPNNLDWHRKHVKLYESFIDENSSRKVILYKSLVTFHEDLLNEIYDSCFDGLVKKQNINNSHLFIMNMSKKINQLASTVNYISKGTYSPLLLTFKCFKRNSLKIDSFQSFLDHISNKNYSSNNLNTILEIDYCSEFDVRELFKLFNEGEDGHINYSNPMNALIIKDTANDIFPVMLSEIIILTLLLKISSIFDLLSTKITKVLRPIFENEEEVGGGCTILQFFPGLFTLICYWAKLHEKHELEFVQILDNVVSGNTSSRLESERYKDNMKRVAIDLAQICLNILNGICSYKMNLNFPSTTMRKKYINLRLIDYKKFLASQNCSFLCTNTFV